MRTLVMAALCVASLLCGCAQNRPQQTAMAPATTPPPIPTSAPLQHKTIVSPDHALIGHVVSVNTTARFAVLNFPPGPMPDMDQHFSLYRDGLKVGEVKITGPQSDDNIVADVVAGDAAKGDEAKNR